MARLPKNVRKHGKESYEFRALVNGQSFVRNMGNSPPEEVRRLAKLYQEEVERERRAQGKRSPTGTVTAFAERFLSSYVPQHRIERDHASVRQRITQYVLPVLGSMQLHAVKRGHLIALADALSKSHLSVGTQRAVLTETRCLFSWAVDLEMLEHNPFLGGKILPAPEENAPDPISDIDIARLRQVLPPQYLPPFLLALHTGMRWAEQRNLEKTDVDLERGEVVLRKTKNGKWRRVPLDPEAVRLLSQMMASTPGPFVMSWRPKFPTFPPRWSRRQEVPVDWHWHQLRHTFACHFLRDGGSIEALSKLLGHASVTTTERYATLFETAVRAEFRRVRGGGPVANSPHSDPKSGHGVGHVTLVEPLS